MEKVKKTPQRKCIGCAERRDKGDLMRIVRTPDGEIRFDTTGRAAGRGAYICKNLECFEKCVKKRVFDRVFQEKLSDEVYESLKEEYAKLGQNS